MIVDDGHGKVDLVLGQVEVTLQVRQRSVRLVDDELRVHLRDHVELTLAEPGRIHGTEVWFAEQVSSVAGEYAGQSCDPRM